MAQNSTPATFLYYELVPIQFQYKSNQEKEVFQDWTYNQYKPPKMY